MQIQSDNILPEAGNETQKIFPPRGEWPLAGRWGDWPSLCLMREDVRVTGSTRKHHQSDWLESYSEESNMTKIAKKMSVLHLTRSIR